MEGKDIPWNGPKLELVIKHYKHYAEFVAAMKERNLLSQYVYPKDVVRPPSPQTPGSM